MIGLLHVMGTTNESKKSFSTEESLHVSTISQHPVRFVLFPLSEEFEVSESSSPGMSCVGGM